MLCVYSFNWFEKIAISKNKNKILKLQLIIAFNEIMVRKILNEHEKQYKLVVLEAFLYFFLSFNMSIGAFSSICKIYFKTFSFENKSKPLISCFRKPSRLRHLFCKSSSSSDFNFLKLYKKQKIFLYI